MKKTTILSAIILLTLFACKKSDQVQVQEEYSRSGHGKPSPSGEAPIVAGLTVRAISPNAVALSWTPPAGATQQTAYGIQRSENLSNDFSGYFQLTPYSNYIDSINVKSNTYYSYRVQATQNGIVGPYCAPVTVKTP